MTGTSPMRLARFLALCGAASRRKAEELIRGGLVLVNGAPVLDPAVKVVPGKDRVEYDGRTLDIPDRFVYYALNKPRGVETSRNPKSRRSAFDLLPPSPPVAAAGRLDADSEGLLIFSNDGDFINLLSHPRYGIPKTYRVRAAGELPPEALRKLMKGVHLAEGKATGKFRIVKRHRDATILEVTIRQGMNRQVRRMLAKVGLKVKSLLRTAVGPVKLGRLPSGQWRPLSPAEVRSLQKAAASPSRRSPSRRGR